MPVSISRDRQHTRSDNGKWTGIGLQTNDAAAEDNTGHRQKILILCVEDHSDGYNVAKSNYTRSRTACAPAGLQRDLV